MVLRAGFLKNTWLYFELMIYDKYRGKNTNPQCVNINMFTVLNFYVCVICAVTPLTVFISMH
jgi:hypothetical protein